MEETKPSRLSPKNGTHEACSSRPGPTGKERTVISAAEVDGGGAFFDCSGKRCRSCTAGILADCVALCCCPCAVVNLLALALVKVPWKVGRRCLGGGKKERKCKKNESGDCVLAERDGRLRNAAAVVSSGGRGGGEEVEESGGGGGGIEAEKVWLELYQIGHLGFGRVSFTEIHQSEDNQ